MSVIGGNFSLIADNDIEVLTVGGRNDGVWSVFARRVPERLELYQFVEVVIPIRIEDTIDSHPMVLLRELTTT